jgi:RNAse (barnase) inhibitor barstar
MKTFLLDGNNFSNMDGFYDEIDRLLTKSLQWKTGHNLNAFNDLLRGGFGVHEYNEPITIRWINYSKSKKDLGDETVLVLLEIMLNCDDTDHDVKVELIG